MRVGRGIGSGKGKQCGRGGKGQTARSGGGKPRFGFEGGQTPLFKRVGKFGFTNPTRLEYTEVNLAQIKVALARGRLAVAEGETITQASLVDAGIIARNTKFPGVKLLAEGKEWFDMGVKIEVAKASQAAIEAVEKAGGQVMCQYYAEKALREHLRGEDVSIKGTPVPRLRPWYESEQNRGYLVQQQQQQ
jgi:large subunit ribosomal protein L15